MKRKRGSESMTYVERLYKRSQENYAHAGGFLESDDEEEVRRERISEARQRRADERAQANLLEVPDSCLLCSKELIDSFLWDKFSYPVCDSCRDDQGKHKLMARTEAKEIYMLKDCDLDYRKPILRYISKKNPHNPRYGDMKLYLKAQLETRCLEIYESWEKFETLKEARSAQREVRREKTYEKKIRAMRKQVRGLTSSKSEQLKPHEHLFGDESYCAKKDEYSKICSVCGYTMVFEKL